VSSENLVVSCCSLGVSIAVATLLSWSSVVDSGAGVASVMAWANTVLFSGDTTGSQLSIASVALVATPEWAATGARGIVVSWGWSIALLLAVMTDKEDLEDSGDQEQGDVDNSNSEDSLLQLACAVQVGEVCDALATSKTETIFAIARSFRVAWSGTKRRFDVPTAGMYSASGEVGNGNVCTDKADIEDNGKEGKEGDTAEEEGQEYTEDAIEDSSS